MEKTQDAFAPSAKSPRISIFPSMSCGSGKRKFTQIRPVKRAGGRRYYRPEDVELSRAIRVLLYSEGYTIKGVQRILKEQGVRGVAARGAPAGGAACRRRGRACRPVSTAPAGERPTPAAPPEEFAGDGTERCAPPASHVCRRRIATAGGILAELTECARILDAARGADGDAGRFCRARVASAAEAFSIRRAVGV